MEETPLEISCGEAKQRLDTDGEGCLLVDCREADEHALVAIDGAKLLPMSELTTRVAELEPHRDRAIIVHCHHGMRSAQVTAWLRGQGFPTVQSMAGGIDQWAVEIEPGMQRY